MTKPVEAIRNFFSQFYRDLGRDAKSKAAWMNAARFAAVFLVSFGVFILVIIPLTADFWSGMGSVHAQTVHGILGWWGIESTVEGSIVTIEVRGEPVDFSISRLCSGDVEIALLASLLIASLDVLLMWRVVGAVIGAGLLLLMNPFRIAITLAITKDSGLEAGDFYHNLIFRLFLFVLLVMYYFAWHRAFARRGLSGRGSGKPSDKNSAKSDRVRPKKKSPGGKT